MMMLQAARLRSPIGRKLTTGLAILISRKTRAPRQATKRTASVATFQKGSLYQSHSCPLLSSTSQQTHRQGEQPQADVVEVQRPAAQLRPLLLEVIGVLDREVAHQVAEDADREVDEEDPAPVVVDRDVAAQRRADDRGDQPRHAEHRHGRALLLGREAVDQDPLAGGLEPAAGHPWITRKRISCSRLVARPHSTEAAVKTAMERRKYLRRPRRAESQPVIGRMVALAAR